MSDLDVTVGRTARRRRHPTPLHMLKALWLVHASGRFDRSDSAWTRALRFYITKGLIVTGTEAAGRNPALFRNTLEGTGFDYAHLAGAAAGECYAAWDNSQFESKLKPWAHQLSSKTWVRSPEYGGKRTAPVHALVVPLDRRQNRTILVVAHMPLDNTPARAEAWVDCCRGLVHLVTGLRARFPNSTDIEVVFDCNKNLRDPHEAELVWRHLEQPLAMVNSWARGLPKTGGTEGRQVMDFALVRRARLAACELLRDLRDSDHRAFRYRLRRG